MPGLAAHAGGVGEERAAQLYRIHGRICFEFTAVEHQLQQATSQALLAWLHIHSAAGIQQSAARLTDMRARKVKIGGGQFQRARPLTLGNRHHE